MVFLTCWCRWSPTLERRQAPWAGRVTEMLNRYKLFADSSVRDIKGYNEMAAQKSMELMPEIVIIIDELADLMMAAPNEVEDAICRLAQMARAAGMHLIIATQRPSVDVITGVIKANIPSRIAFSVSSQVDSRTIIDSGGRRKTAGQRGYAVLPHGDAQAHPAAMLLCVRQKKWKLWWITSSAPGKAPNTTTPFWMKSTVRQKPAPIRKGKKSEEDAAGGDEADPLLDKAIEVVIESGPGLHLLPPAAVKGGAIPAPPGSSTRWSRRE